MNQLIITDQADRQVSVNFPIKRIVSLAPNITESVYALGAEDFLVGVTEFCDYPPSARVKPKVSGYSTVDTDRIKETTPDLILASKIHLGRCLPELETCGCSILIMESSTLTGMLKTIEILGQCTGKDLEAKALIAKLNERINSVLSKTKTVSPVKRPRVYYLHELETWKTFGSGTIGDALTELAGGFNVGHEFGNGYPRPTLAEIVSTNPDIVIAETGYGEDPEAPLKRALNEPQLAHIKARVTGQIYGVDSSLISRAGPRMVDGLEKLAGIFHPKWFWTGC
jgi:iron complex transport system substrate-binding protein